MSYEQCEHGITPWQVCDTCSGRDGNHAMRTMMQVEVTELRTQNAAMREALETVIRSGHMERCSIRWEFPRDCNCAFDIAKKALEGK